MIYHQVKGTLRLTEKLTRWRAGRDNAIFTEPTPSHTKCLTACRACADSHHHTCTDVRCQCGPDVLCRGSGALHLPWGSATIVPEAQRVGGLSRCSFGTLCWALLWRGKWLLCYKFNFALRKFISLLYACKCGTGIFGTMVAAYNN